MSKSDILEKILAVKREEVAAAKARNDAAPIAHDLDEAGTRSAYIDALLDEAGWDPHGTDVAEYTVECDPGIARPQKYW